MQLIKLVNDYGTLPVLVFVCYICYKMFVSERAKADKCAERRFEDIKEHTDDTKALLQTTLKAIGEMQQASKQVAEACKEIKDILTK